MSAEIANVSGHVLTMKVSGTLTQPELAAMQPRRRDHRYRGQVARAGAH